jgi:hypothetical protein
LFFVHLVVQGTSELHFLEVGMVELHLSSGATAYLQRRTVLGRPAELYLSSSYDYCAPYDHWHDYKLPAPLTGVEASPLVITMSGDALIVHGPNRPTGPWLSGPKDFRVQFSPMSLSDYSALAAKRSARNEELGDLSRVEVP